MALSENLDGDSVLPDATLTVERRAVDDLKPYWRNPRINDPHVERMAGILDHFGQVIPILVSGTTIVDGHLRWKAARKLGWERVDCVDVSGMDPDDVQALRIVLNKSAEWVDWDQGALAAEMAELEAKGHDLALTGFDADELKALKALAALEAGGGPPADGVGSERVQLPTLADRFGVPPFSVLDARQGYWQARKRTWLAYGIQSELGRGANRKEDA
jgi:hypothetical protein